MERLKSLSFLQHENKWHRFFYLLALVIIMYLTTNRWHLFSPNTVSKTWFDTAVPFIPETVFFYTSYFLTIISVFFLERDKRFLDSYCLALLGMNIFCNLIFLLYPTTYDARPPLAPAEIHWLVRQQFDFIYFFDSPANCLPSLHVANSFLATLHWFRRSSGKFVFYVVWTLIICASTLTTKQHYFYDVLGGLVIAIAWYAGVYRRAFFSVSRSSAAVSN